MTDFEGYRKKYLEYLPEDGIRWLLIAESPPKQKEGGVPSFFYYDEDRVEDVALMFKETMTALFDPNWLEPKWLDRNCVADSKRKLLRRFSRRGFYLLDALEEKPVEKTRAALHDARTKDTLQEKIMGLVKEGYVTNETQIIIIGKRVHRGIFEFMKNELRLENGLVRLSIRNTEPVNLPNAYYWRDREAFRDYLRSLPSTAEVVRCALEDFLTDFLESPYLCYTEHGMHALFYHRLMNSLPNESLHIRVGGRDVCAVQKEYRMGSDVGKSRKAHWDIAVLEKSQSAESENWYDNLRLNSVAEFGLNSDGGHFEDDVERLSHELSGVLNCFIVNLYRYSKSLTGRDWQNEHEAFVSPIEMNNTIRKHGNKVVAYFAMVDDTTGRRDGPYRIDGKSSPSKAPWSSDRMQKQSGGIDFIGSNRKVIQPRGDSRD
jgi:hypothetical protein